MFINFFYYLRKHNIPVTLSEHLTLLEALQKGVIKYNVDDFYALSRAIYIKHEQHLDRFDTLFGNFFGEIDNIPVEKWLKIPEEWLKKTDNLREFSQEEKDKLEADFKISGGLEDLMKRFEEIFNQQKEQHEGGNTWIGANGTSPFGINGYNPEGIRIGESQRKQGKAVKVWDKRFYKNLDDDVELDTRTMKIALKRLRILTRKGIASELDLDKTLKKTSENAGNLDIIMRPSQKNNIKVLMFFDVGGSMDTHIRTCEQFFSASRYEFKHLEFFYFHNCIYESVWKDNNRRWEERFSTWDILNKYNSDYKVIIVGDATMAPYEITSPNGSVEHNNPESGITWLTRLKNHFPYIVWLNPTITQYWGFTNSIQILNDFMQKRMFPLTIDGLTRAMKALKDKTMNAEN
jgi:uncharacterized protein